MRRRWCSGVVATLVAACALGGTAAGAPLQTAARAVPPAPKFAVGVRTLDLEDRSRATPADPEGQTPVPASRTRALPTTVVYPAATGTPGADGTPDAVAHDGRYPLVLFSHGTPGTPDDYLPLLQTWAAAGYVVAAPRYPVSSLAGPGEVTAADQRDQVRDARFVLDRLLALNRVPAGRGGLDGIIDPRHVGAAGHSEGGLTTLALVSDCCRDRRVGAAVVLAGVRDNGGPPRIRGTRGPILFVHATGDLAVRYSESEAGYREAAPPKYLLEVQIPFGLVSHTLLFRPGGAFPLADEVAAVTDAFLDAYVRGEGDPARIRRVAAGSEQLVLHQSP